MPDFVIGQNDTAPALLRTFLDATGAPIDIQGATITFRLTPIRGGTDVYSGTALNLQNGNGADGTKGNAGFGQGAAPWTGVITQTPGDYLARFKADFGAGRVEQIPNEGYLLVTITPAVPDVASGLYLGVEELKKSLGTSGSSAADQDVTRAIKAASRAVDNYCRRTFTLGSPGEVRPVGPVVTADYVEVPDLVTLTSLTMDGVTVANDGLSWWAERWPTEPTAPFVVLWRVTGGTWPKLNLGQNVVITGQYGWPAPPDPIIMATQVVASRLVKRGREAPFGILPFGDQGEAMRITQADPDLRFLLDPYKKSQRR